MIRLARIVLSVAIVFHFHASHAQELPNPDGKYTVGTVIFNLQDPSRFDTLFKIPRVTSIQVWYPSAKTTSRRRIEYIPEPKLAKYIVQSGYYGLDSITLRRLATLTTHSYGSAPKAKVPGGFPVLLFSPGMGVLRANYTSLFENLASNGIVIIAIDHMYEGSAILPDGRIADINSYPDSVYDALYHDCVVDVSFVVDKILDTKTAVGRFLKGHIDPHNICASGHSSGGNIALCAAAADKRIAASINLDGGDFTCPSNGITTPCLMLLESPDYSDDELRKKGRDIQKWRGDSLTALKPFFAIMDNIRSTSFLVKIRQTGHMSFSDAPFLMPQMLTMFLGTYLPPEQNLHIICGLVKDFVNNHQLPAAELSGILGRYEKIRIWFRDHSQ